MKLSLILIRKQSPPDVHVGKDKKRQRRSDPCAARFPVLPGLGSQWCDRPGATLSLLGPRHPLTPITRRAPCAQPCARSPCQKTALLNPNLLTAFRTTAGAANRLRLLPEPLPTCSCSRPLRWQAHVVILHVHLLSRSSHHVPCNSVRKKMQ